MNHCRRKRDQIHKKIKSKQKDKNSRIFCLYPSLYGCNTEDYCARTSFTFGKKKRRKEKKTFHRSALSISITSI